MPAAYAKDVAQSTDRMCLICRCEVMRSSGFQKNISSLFISFLPIFLARSPSLSRLVRSRRNNQSDQIRFLADIISVVEHEHEQHQKWPCPLFYTKVRKPNGKRKFVRISLNDSADEISKA